jgi:hypothetical protein
VMEQVRYAPRRSRMMTRWIRIIRWIARIWSVLSIVALLLPYFM